MSMLDARGEREVDFQFRFSADLMNIEEILKKLHFELECKFSNEFIITKFRQHLSFELLDARTVGRKNNAKMKTRRPATSQFNMLYQSFKRIGHRRQCPQQIQRSRCSCRQVLQQNHFQGT